MTLSIRPHRFASLLLLTLCLSACRLTQTPGPTTSPAILAPNPIPGVDNFAQVSPVLYRGAQPTRQGFIELQSRGIKTILNLRTSDTDRDDLQGLHLNYIRIPSRASKPKDPDLAKVLKVIQDPANQPVFIHCHRGADRTGFAIAAYRMVEQGWSYEEATAEMDHFKFNHLYQGILHHLRQLNPAQMKQLIASSPSPKPETPD
ncbi:MAG: fused DSP-PTPase phosphatase/NAD kinase-like protein [Bacillota bacterium]